VKSVWWLIVGAVLAINGAVAAQEADLLPKAVLPNSKINLTKATIEGGRLVVQGTTAAPNTKVTLDGRFNVTSRSDRTFSFSLAYLPTDCIADLSTPSGADKAVIALCGQQGSPGSRIVVFNRTCSGAADDPNNPNDDCRAQCNLNQRVLSATLSVTKNAKTVSGPIALTSETEVRFTKPTVAYDSYSIRLVCLVLP
jgi:hypothetical protein